MLNITLNGEARRFTLPNATAATLIEHLGYTGKRIALERNGEIVPKSEYPNTPIENGDTLEVVVAVGGG